MLAGLLLLVIVAGAAPRFARHAPRVALLGTLASVLALSLSNPDRRIAQAALDRYASGRAIDTEYLGGLSADALPELRRLPSAVGRRAAAEAERRLRRPDGVAGLNLARAAAR